MLFKARNSLLLSRTVSLVNVVEVVIMLMNFMKETLGKNNNILLKNGRKYRSLFSIVFS